MGLQISRKLRAFVLNSGDCGMPADRFGFELVGVLLRHKSAADLTLQRHGSRGVLGNLRECCTASANAFSKKADKFGFKLVGTLPANGSAVDSAPHSAHRRLCQKLLPSIPPRPPTNRAKMRTTSGSSWSPVDPLKMPEKPSQLSRYVRSSGIRTWCRQSPP